MKKTKFVAAALALGMTASLTSCIVVTGSSEETTAAGTSVSATTAEETTTEETTTTETAAVSEATTEETTTTETAAVSETTSEETSTTAETAASETSASEETTAEATKYKHTDDEKYVDFDDMHFFINGKKYTLGKTTLREMISDRVPFDEDDLIDIRDTVKANHYSQPFRIRLDKYWAVQVSVINPTDDDREALDLVIGKIYLPNETDQEQDVLSFDFPIDIKPADLIAVEGKPEGEKGDYSQKAYLDTKTFYETFTYKKRAEKYYGNSSYVFEFTNDRLEKLTIEYRP